MTALLGAYSYPNVIAFSHRFSRRTLTRSVLCSSALSAAAMLAFMRMEPFDEMHQKRLFVIHMENVRFEPPSDFFIADSLLPFDLDHNERKPSAGRECGCCAWL